MFNFDLRPLIVFGAIGLVASLLAVIVGVPWLIYYLWTHLAWLP